MESASQKAPLHRGLGVRPSAALALIYALFMVSGSAGLIYQVAWKHTFTVVFGSTTYAVCVVISVFMAGLALGSHVFGKVADRTRRHLLLFALLQLGVGASGLLVPHALQGVEGVYLAVFRTFESAALLTAVQVVVSMPILLVPTFLMGGTLPLLSRFVATRSGRVGRAVGILYGLNTLGAAGGAFLTGFVLIKLLGTMRTLYLAAGLNVCVAAAFVLLHAFGGVAQEEPPAERTAPVAEAPLGPGRLRLILLMVTIAGFVSFSYEVLWTRLLMFKFENTVYAFSMMLTTFLLGLGLGGAAVGLLLGKAVSKAHCWRIFGGLEAAIGICGLATIAGFFAGPTAYESFAHRVLAQFGASALVMLVPTTLMGAAFPIACHLYATGVEQTGRSVGRIYVFNTAGAVAGALVTGFYLVRVLGTQGSMTAVSFLMVLGGCLVLAVGPGGARAAPRRALSALLAPAVACGAALIVWALMPSDSLQRYFLDSQRIIDLHAGQDVSLLGYAEGVEGVAVVVGLEDGHRTLATGSTDVAGTFFSLRNTQKLQAHVPMLVHPNPKEVCQIGFGSGETAGIFASYDVDRFDCVEISAAVVEMAGRHFTDINREVVGDPRCNIILMDATTYLRYTDRKYDIIANDATWPYLAGPAMLYTREYFEYGRDHLMPGGIMTSWLPFDMPLEDLRILLKTFHEVFPHVYVWTSLYRGNKHGLIIGKQEPLSIDAARFQERFDRFARDDLEIVYLNDPALFLTCHLSSAATMGPDLASARLNTQDCPRLQFMTSRPEHYDVDARMQYVANALRLLAANRESVLDRLVNIEALEQPESFLAKLRLTERAVGHVLRSLVLTWDDPPQSQAELRAAEQLAPAHPAIAAVDEAPAGQPTPPPRRPDEYAVEELNRLAAGLHRRGEFARALLVYEELLLRGADEEAACVGAGLCHLNLGRTAAAVQYLSRALELNPRLFGPRLGLGVAHLRSGRPDQAIHHLEEALKLDPDSAEALTRIGAAYAMKGDVEAALTHLARATQLAPDRVAAHANAGILLLNAGRPDEALAYLEKFAHLNPESPQAHSLLSQAYRQTGNGQAAERHARRAEELGAEAAAPAPPGR